MAINACDMGSAFSEWEALALAYEEGIEALRLRKPGAADALMKISRELQECEGADIEKRAATRRG